ncbi:hypothetical protein B0T14DRAFT_291231 [Immersiella caudata]|uniref:Uncharacterized protein n=1 Tax=Immersiella caudata TaxID=314043 RepID=A0AA39WEM4_9PEZI|nr:hypothetical protein B0T14DRAFT_291231 [Immersiella caudata]
MPTEHGTRNRTSPQPQRASQSTHGTITSAALPGQTSPFQTPVYTKSTPVYISALQSFLRHLFNTAMCTYDTCQGLELEWPNRWWLNPLYNNRTATIQSLSSSMNNLTTAATNLMRTTGFGPDESMDGAFSSTYLRGSGYGVRGEVIRALSCTYFDWRWLLFPSGLLVINMALLAWVVVLSWPERVPLWKNSVLPFLFYGLGERESGLSSPDESSDGSRDMTVAGMEKRAKGVMASCSASSELRTEGDNGFAKDSDVQEGEGEEGYLMDYF